MNNNFCNIEGFNLNNSINNLRNNLQFCNNLTRNLNKIIPKIIVNKILKNDDRKVECIGEYFNKDINFLLDQQILLLKLYKNTSEISNKYRYELIWEENDEEFIEYYPE